MGSSSSMEVTSCSTRRAVRSWPAPSPIMARCEATFTRAPSTAIRAIPGSLSTGSRSRGPSEALGVLVDAYDRIFPVGYITANGATQARLMVLIHG
jgi:hypothetical protein